MRMGGPKWNHAKLYGFFAASWFFLLEKRESESLPECGCLRQHGSVLVHLMRNSDDLCIIMKWSAQQEHHHSLLLQWFSSVAFIFSTVLFCLSDCSQTIYLLIELQRKRESQKLLHRRHPNLYHFRFTGRDILQPLPITEEALKFCCQSIDLQARQADHTCVPSVPVHFDTPTLAMDGGKPLIFGFDLCCVWMT